MSDQRQATVAVSGVTGALGGRVASLLAGHGVPQLLVGRDPSRIPTLANAEPRGPADYQDEAAMRAALDGASTLVLVSGRPSGRRLEEHATAVEAGKAVGVERVLYVSLLGAAPTATYRNARDHWLTERYLAGADVRCTVFRAGIYSSMIPRLAGEDLVVRGPAGAGRAAFVSHDDIAAVIAEVARDTRPEHDGAVIEITGPESVTLHDATAQLAAATGRSYRYQDETLEEAFAWRWRAGLSGEQIETWISWYQAIACGEWDRVSGMSITRREAP